MSSVTLVSSPAEVCGGCRLSGEGRLTVVAVHPRQVLGDLAGAADHYVEIGPEQRAQVVNGEDVGRVRHADDRGVIAVPEGEHPVATRQSLGDQFCRLRIERLLVQVDELHAGFGGRGTDEVFF